MSSESISSARDVQPDVEVDRLKERLAFYESFDRLIQDNVTQAGNLLREAVDLRENAAAGTESARRRLESERMADRERYRALFSVMLDEITTLQGQAERLAVRLTDAIDQLEQELGPGAEFPHLTANLAAELDVAHEPPATYAAESIDESPEELPPGSPDPQPGEPVALGTGTAALERASTGDIVASDTIAEPEPALRESEKLEIGSLGQPAPHTSQPAHFVLLAHGVARAATALSLKRHLETLDAVQAVAPREFAAGVLRLQLEVSRDLTGHDLDHWVDGAGMTTIHARPGLLEVRLNS